MPQGHKHTFTPGRAITAQSSVVRREARVCLRTRLSVGWVDFEDIMQNQAFPAYSCFVLVTQLCC